MKDGRKAVYDAFFALMKESAGFVEVSQTPFSSDALGTARMPMMEILGQQEFAEFKALGIPIIWRIHMDLMVYCDTSDPSAPAYDTLNTLIDAMDAAMTPDPATGVVTLGGLVADVHFNGTILKDPSFQSGIGAASVPIEIITTA